MARNPKLSLEEVEAFKKRGFEFFEPICQGTSGIIYEVVFNPQFEKCLDKLFKSSGYSGSQLEGGKVKDTANEDDDEEGETSQPQVTPLRSVDLPKTMPTKLACKLIDVQTAPKDYVNKFLLREIDIISKISHPNIIHTHSIFMKDNRYFIFMRYAECGNLCDFLVDHGHLRENQARFWFRQLAAAVDYLHKINIAHRDIKCENVLITSNHNVKLCDFGFSRFTVDFGDQHVMSTTFCGSVSYSPPELITGTEYDPKQSDIWSLGVTLFVMFNKSLPFCSDNLTNLWLSQVKKEFQFRTKIKNTLSSEAIKIVRDMMEPNLLLRLSSEGVLNSPWILKDERYNKLTKAEKAAIERSKRMKQSLKPTLRKAPHLLANDRAQLKNLRRIEDLVESEEIIPLILVGNDE